MNREPTKRTRQALPGRRQFLSALGAGAGLVCAAERSRFAPPSYG